MLAEDPTSKDGAAEGLLRRALLDDSSAVAVSLRVDGLPVSVAVTVIFHARRDLGTLQTYVTVIWACIGSANPPACQSTSCCAPGPAQRASTTRSGNSSSSWTSPRPPTASRTKAPVALIGG